MPGCSTAATIFTNWPVIASFEEIVWLLLHGELPDMRAAWHGATRELSGPNAACRRRSLDMLALLPAETHPMDVLRTGVSMLASFDPDLNDHSHAANLRKAIRLIAKVSALIADGWRISQGEDPCPTSTT